MPERASSSMQRTPLVLASGSPRRRWLLEKLGIPFEVLPVGIDERLVVGEAASDFAQRLADEKARAAVDLRPLAWILAGDTVVAIDGDALGKPCDAAEAVAMLQRLSGRRHVVYTGLTLLAPGGRVTERLVMATDVAFRRLDPDEIATYLATGEPFDRAGAYAIQGEGAHLVDRVEGSYTNVIGLPLPEVARWLRV
jgi:septum formation protein